MPSVKSNNIISDITGSLIKGSSSETVDIITFVEANWGFNIKLTLAQRVILKAFYSIPLNDEDLYPVYDVVKEKTIGHFTEKTFMRWLYENKRCNYPDIPTKKMNELVLVAGRRSGKSLLSACIIGYEFYKLVKHQDPAKFYGKPDQASIKVLNVAPTTEQADVVFDAASTAISHCPTLKNRLSNQTQSYFSLFSDEDIKQGKNKASLSFITGGCSSNGLRGHDAIVVCMDEMAFFINNGGKFSGDEVYGALTPSTLQFRGDGKTICISSPYAKYGKFYDLYRNGMEEKESTTLVFQMYTAMVNPDNIASDDLKLKRRRDRNKFLAEYCAEFSDTVSAWIDDPDEFIKCIDKSFQIPSKGKVDTRYYARLDVGMKNDGTAISIVHEENGEFLLDYSNVWFSGQSDIWDDELSIYRECDRYKHKSILSMEDIVKEIKELNKWFPIKEGILDQHQGYSIIEFLERENLKMFRLENFNDTKNSELYAVAKRLYGDGLLKLWEHPVLVPELLSLEQERKGAGVDGKNESFVKIDVRAPSRKGAHDDISESYVRAVFLAYTGKRTFGDKKTVMSRNKRTGVRSYNDYLLEKYRNGFTQRPTTGRIWR